MKSLLFFVALYAMAQTSGLPEYGLLLEGTADSPVLHNNSAKRILAFALRYDNNPSSAMTSFFGPQSRPFSEIGIAPGAVYPPPPFVGAIGRGGGVRARDKNGLPIQHTSATLDAVLFEDGHLVGPDVGGFFQQLTQQIKDEQEVAAVLLTGTDRVAAWQTIESISTERDAPPLPGAIRISWRRMCARQLLQARARQGENAAIRLAESTKNYPTIVKER